MADAGKVVRRADIPVASGKQSVETARRWLREQIPYANFAGKNEVLDRRAEQFVMNHRERFRGRMSTTMQRWSTNWCAANGEALWHENEDDVHIPETKKAIDSKVARVEEGITEFDPIFEAEGTRGDLPRYKAQLIGSYTYRLMELARWRELVQPVARDAELCNIAAVKVAWEHEPEDVVERTMELRFRKESGDPYYHDERKIRRAIAKVGPRYRLVDPFWFFYDIDASEPNECEYIGDESEMFVYELEQQAELGRYPQKQIDLVKERRAGMRSVTRVDGTNHIDITDQYRSARNIASSFAFTTTGPEENAAAKVRVIECWAKFDFRDGVPGVSGPFGEKLTGTHRVVITLAAGIIIRFQLNPHDRKFVPYAICRLNRNGHEMVAPSQFDHVVQLNALYDHVRSNTIRQHGLAGAPIIVTSNDTDMPDTILGVLPGSVLKCTGTWDIVKVPDPNPAAVAYQDNYFRREIEEVSGALRVFEQQPGSTTATETERKVQEQQRMVRNSIRASGDLWRQTALITYWLSAQFATGPERFAVAGKAASVLTKSATMTPDILQEDVDFKFVGLESLHTFGARNANRAQWMTRWGPLLPNMSGVNLMALARQDFEETVGRSNIDEIFPNAVPPWDTMPQEEENVMILSGHQVPVSKQDDDMDHIKKVMRIVKDPKVADYIKGLAVEHMNEHLTQALQKEAEQKAAELEAQQRAEVQAPGGGSPGSDKPAAAGGLPAQKKDITPGPPQARTQPRTGRAGSGQSQSQAMSA